MTDPPTQATDVKCPFCGSEPGVSCVAASGQPYEPHSARRKAQHQALNDYARANPVYSHPLPPKAPRPYSYTKTRPPRESKSPVANIKLALWFIDKAGGEDAARVLFDAACAALRAANNKTTGASDELQHG